MYDFLGRLATALTLSLPMLAFAQQTGEPADTKASAPSLRYRSAFADYKPWQEIRPGDWRQLNDNLRPEAGAAGGHAGHGAPVSAASQAPASAPAPAPKASPPATPAQQGQPMHGGKR